jgi:short subunit dehydrogenase-like uncharacterized protein
MAQKDWMIYGANGYTGALIAREALRRGERPVLAGRDGKAVAHLAAELGLPSRTFSLDPRVQASALDGVDLVLHCAGPFSATSAPMIEACLAARAHYLDITGEIAVFEAAAARDAEAREARIALLPGVGFDVVPTDCAAAMLKERLPEATELRIAFQSSGSSSRGTARTMVEGLHKGDAWREGGRIRLGPAGARVRSFTLGGKERLCAGFPWGDVSTAWHSTRIPNVSVYLSLPPAIIKRLPLVSRLGQSAMVRRLLRTWVDLTVRGPDAELRATARSYIHAEASSPDGRSASVDLSTPEGYAFTALAAVESVIRLRARPQTGFLTPSRAFGSGFAFELPGVTLA